MSSADHEAPCCRICRCEAEQDRPLLWPCKCSGTIAFVHQDCLLAWLNVKKAEKCELCNHAFSFTKVFRQDAPSQLPLGDFIWGLLRKANHSARFGLRILVVTLTWLFVAPTLTCWLWRIAFVRSFPQVLNAILKRFEPVLILADCIQGIVISCCLICAVLFCSAAWDYILQYWTAFAPHVMPPADRNVLPPGTELAEAAPALLEASQGSAEAAEQQAAERPSASLALPTAQQQGARHQAVDASAQSPADDGLSGPSSSQRAGSASERDDSGDALLAGSSASGTAAEPIAQPQAPAGPPAGRQIQPVQQRDDNREVDFDALLGLEGPIIGLFENAAMIVLLAALMLFAAFWLPFTIGRCVLSALAGLQLDHASLVLKAMAHDPAQLRSGALVHTAPGAPGSAASSPEDAAGLAAAVMVLERVLMELEAHLAQPSVTDWAVLAVGYVVLSCLALAGLWLYLAWRIVRSGRQGRGLAWVRHALSMAGRQFRVHLVRLGFGAKVVSMLLTELVVLPIAHGYFVHMCAWPLVHTRPAIYFGISFVLLHWLIGMGFLMATAGFLSVSRSVLRPEALPFLRDPYAFDDEEPFGQMMTAPIREQMYKAATGFAIMACLAVACIHVPVQLAKVISPGLFPLHLKLVDALAELPADLLLFHVCLPLTLPYLNIRGTMRRGVQWWLTKAAVLLDLEEYLLRRPPAPFRNQAGQRRAMVPAANVWGGQADPGNSHQGQAALGSNLEGKLMLLLGLLALTVIGLITAGLLLPVHTGRLLLTALRVPLRHDLYVAAAGCYALWAIAKLLGGMRSLALSPNMAGVMRKLARGVFTGLSAVMLIVTALGVLSLMTGVLADLVLAPFRLPARSTPMLLMQQEWCLGLVSLKFVHHTMAGIPDRRLLRQPYLATIKTYIWPPLQLVAALLSVPCLVTRGILPHCGLSAGALQVSWVWGWFVELAALGLSLLYRIGLSKARELRRALHEEKYLVGRQLLNLTRIPPASAPVSNHPQETPAAEHAGSSSLQAAAAM